MAIYGGHSSAGHRQYQEVVVKRACALETNVGSHPSSGACKLRPWACWFFGVFFPAFLGLLFPLLLTGSHFCPFRGCCEDQARFPLNTQHCCLCTVGIYYRQPGVLGDAGTLRLRSQESVLFRYSLADFKESANAVRMQERADCTSRLDLHYPQN